MRTRHLPRTIAVAVALVAGAFTPSPAQAASPLKYCDLQLTGDPTDASGARRLMARWVAVAAKDTETTNVSATCWLQTGLVSGDGEIANSRWGCAATAPVCADAGTASVTISPSASSVYWCRHAEWDDTGGHAVYDEDSDEFAAGIQCYALAL